MACPLQDLQASLLVPRRERFPAGEPLEVTFDDEEWPAGCVYWGEYRVSHKPTHFLPSLSSHTTFAGTLNWFKLFWYSSLWGFSLVIISSQNDINILFSWIGGDNLQDLPKLHGQKPWAKPWVSGGIFGQVHERRIDPFDGRRPGWRDLNNCQTWDLRWFEYPLVN